MSSHSPSFPPRVSSRSSILSRFFPSVVLLACAAAPASLFAQAAAPALALGSLNVGSSTTATVTFTFAAPTTVTAVSVLSQGATNGEFQRNTGAPGSCAAATYQTNYSCTVGVTFTPGAPGLRYGAVTLATSSGSQAGGIAYISGIGQGGIPAFSSGTLTPITGTASFGNAFGLASDAANNVYVTDHTGGAVYKEAISGTVANQTTIATGLTNVGGVAVDGAGNVYIADGNNRRILLETYSGGVYTASTVYSCSNACSAVQVDAAGNLFIGNASTVIEDVLSTVTPGLRTPTQIASGFNSITSIAVDPAGNLYLADQGTSSAYLLTYNSGAGTYATSTIASGVSNLDGISLDPAGNIYVGTNVSGAVYRYTPAGGGTYTHTTLASVSGYANGVTVAPHGVVYTNNGASTLYKLDQTVSASSTSSSLNYTSPDTAMPLSNIGNSSFLVTGSSTAAPFAFASSNACTSRTVVPSATSCSITYNFSPTATGTQTGTLQVTTTAGSGTVNLTGNVSSTATKVGFYTAPATPIVAGGNPGMVQAILEDANSYFVTTAGVNVSLSSNYAGTTSYPSVTTAANGGLATFASTTPALTTTGTYTYTAASTGLTSATASETVVAGPATHLTAVPGSTSVYIGQADTITVTALDQYGNQSTATDTVSLAASPSTATLPANFALSNGAGSGQVTFTAAGTYTVTAQDVTNSAVTSGTSAQITVKPLPVFVVGTLADDATGVAANCPDTANGGTATTTCTLRDAVAASNALYLTGTTGPQAAITFAPRIYAPGATPTCTVSSITTNGTTATTTAPCIQLNQSSYPLSLTANVNIAGPGPAALAISGNSTHGILTTAMSYLNLAVSNLTLTQGYAASGGAIYVSNTGIALTLSNDVFFKNRASNFGGAVNVNVSGSLTITSSTFDANTASTTGTCEGGAVYVTTTPLTINGSTFSNNLANPTNSSAGEGGALFAFNSPVNVRNSSFIGNSVSGSNTTEGGAVVGTGGTAVDTYTNVVFLGNTVTGSITSTYGGAIYYQVRSLALIDSLVQGNSVTSSGSFGKGGGVYGVTGTIYLYNTTVTGNYAKVQNGGTLGTLEAYNSIVYGNSSPSFPDTSAVTTGVGSLTNIGSTVLDPVLSAPANTGSFAGPINGAGAYAAAQYTVIPLPGSPALRFGSTSTSACTVYPTGFASGASCLAGQTTDARGYARTTSVGSNTYVDAGQTQANYTAAYVYQPANALVGQTIAGQTSFGATNPSPTLQVYEQGQPFVFGTFAATESSLLTVGAAAGTLAGTTMPLASTTTAPAGAPTTGASLGVANAAILYSSGVTNLAGLSLSPAETNDTLLGTFCVGTCTTTPQNLVAVSNPFNVIGTIAYTTPPPADVALNAAIPAIVVRETGSNGTAYVSGDTVTLTVTGPSSYSHVYTTTSTTGSFSFNVLPLATAGTYTYTASDSTYTTQTAVATEVAGTQLLGSLTVTGFPTADHNGTAHTITVTAYDTTGAVFTGYTGSVALTSNDPLATLPAPYTFVAGDNGVHTFSVTLATGGTRSITATDTATGIKGMEIGIFVDDFIWVLNNTGTTTRLDETGALLTNGGTAGTAGTRGGLAFDAGGNGWSVLSSSNSLSMTPRAGTSPTIFSGTGGLNVPVSVAVDGAGVVWVANSGGSSVSAFTNAGVAKSGATGYAPNVLNAPSQVGIDATGGVWVTNKTGNSLVHIFGAATPVVTPAATAVKNGAVGVTP